MAVTERTRMIEAVQGLLDELCSPDLTLGRAKVLRPRLYELLEALAASAEGPDAAAGGTWDASFGFHDASVFPSRTLCRMTCVVQEGLPRIPAGA